MTVGIFPGAFGGAGKSNIAFKIDWNIIGVKIHTIDKIKKSRLFWFTGKIKIRIQNNVGGGGEGREGGREREGLPATFEFFRKAYINFQGLTMIFDPESL